MQNWGEALPCTEGMAGTSLCRAEHSPHPFPRARQAPASSPTPTAPGSCPHLPTHTQRGGSPGAAQEGWGGQGQHSWGRGGCRPAFTDIIYVSATFTHFTGAGPKMKRCAQSHVSGWGKMQTRVSRCLDECSSCHPIPEHYCCTHLRREGAWSQDEQGLSSIHPAGSSEGEPGVAAVGVTHPISQRGLRLREARGCASGHTAGGESELDSAQEPGSFRDTRFPLGDISWLFPCAKGFHMEPLCETAGN